MSGIRFGAGLRKAGSQLRRHDASFLLYALLDAIVDHCFPILESYGNRLESLEKEVLAGAGQEVMARIHRLRRELLLFRREVWPMLDVIRTLQREPHECLGDTTRTYLRDVHDHILQIIDLGDTYREFAAGLAETYMSSLSIRMNEVIKVLTIITTIFIPITFLAGVYGMNFRYMPEADWVVGLSRYSGRCAWCSPAACCCCSSARGGSKHGSGQARSGRTGRSARLQCVRGGPLGPPRKRFRVSASTVEKPPSLSADRQSIEPSLVESWHRAPQWRGSGVGVARALRRHAAEDRPRRAAAPASCASSVISATDAGPWMSTSTYDGVQS